MSCINKVLGNPEYESKFDRLCDDFDIKRVQPCQRKFVSEYVKVMGTISKDLDLLQGEQNIVYGHLIPTMCMIHDELQDLKKAQAVVNIQKTRLL